MRIILGRAAIITVCALVISAGSPIEASKIDGTAPCESLIFCHGDFLNAMQLSDHFRDSKEFVDRPLRVDPADVLHAFRDSKERVSKERLLEILNRNFSSVGEDLEDWTPEDWKEANPVSHPLLARIKDRTLREWAYALHENWRELSRKTAPSVQEHPDRHSLIHLPHPFIVHASGDTGRTREQHYWESYWTIHGLLISEMHSTAKGMILNYAHLIDRFGYVPMGNRVYYQQRPHPPLLSAMVHLYWNHAKSDADEFIKTLLPAIAKEYNFWMTHRTVDVVIDGKTFALNRYKGSLTTPRPESYREDLDTARSLRIKDRAIRKSAEEKLYGNIAGASESGWEFSSRWLDKPSSIKSLIDIRTEDIVPVDLNAFLCMTERHLSFFYEVAGEDKKSQEFAANALRRGNAIRDVFWNASLNMWRDFDLRDNRQRAEFYMSSLTPLFAACNPENLDIMEPDFLRRLIASADVQKLMSYPGGMPASLVKVDRTCQSCQWDYPNFWPPLSLFLIVPLSQVPELLPVARNISQNIITALYREEGTLFEKYHVEKVGSYGTGGEYTVMQGYAPTNGAILRILEIFPKLRSPLSNEILNEQEEAEHNNNDNNKKELPVQDGTEPNLESSPSSSVLPPVTDNFVKASEKSVIPDKPDLIFVEKATIAVKRVRMDVTTAAPSVAGPAMPNVRQSKNVRDDRKNCQSLKSFSMSTVLLLLVIAVFF